MAVEKHGIELFLTQNVDAALESAAKAAHAARGAVSKVGATAASAFTFAGNAVTVFNQGLEIAKKALEVFRATIGETIAKALEFRGLNDDTARFFKTMARESELVRARLGDALLPVIRGFIEAIGETTGKLSEWIAKNRELIGSGLTEFIGGTAKALVTGLARAVEFVGKAFLGLKATIQIVKIAFNAYYDAVLTGIAGMLGAFAKLLDIVGLDGLGGKVKGAQAAVAGLGEEFGRSADDASEALNETARQYAVLDNTISRVEATVNRVVDKGMVAAQKRVAESVKGTNSTLDEQRERLERINATIDAISQKRIAAIDEGAARFEADARGVDAQGGGGGAGGLVQASLGALGDVGGIVSGALQEGLTGAVTAAIGAIIASSEALGDILDEVAAIFADVVASLDPLFMALKPLVGAIGGVVRIVLDALRPVFEALASAIHPIAVIIGPLVQIFMTMSPVMIQLRIAVQALEPVIKVLGEVLKIVAGFILDVGESIARVWNGIVNAIASVLQKLGGIEIFGKKPLGFLEDWGDDLVKKGSISLDAFDDARDQLENGWDTAAEQLNAGAEVIADTVDDMQRQLTNVPTILKVALAEFRAADPYRPNRGDVGARGGEGAVGLAIAAAAAGGNGSIRAETINMYGLGRTDEVVEEVAAEARRRGVSSEGALAAARSAIARIK